MLDILIKDHKSLNFEIFHEILLKSLQLVSESKYENHISFGLENLIKFLKMSKEPKFKKIEGFIEVLKTNKRIGKIKNDSKKKYSIELKNKVNNIYKLLKLA